MNEIKLIGDTVIRASIHARVAGAERCAYPAYGNGSYRGYNGRVYLTPMKDAPGKCFPRQSEGGSHLLNPPRPQRRRYGQ